MDSSQPPSDDASTSDVPRHVDTSHQSGRSNSGHTDRSSDSTVGAHEFGETNESDPPRKESAVVSPLGPSNSWNVDALVNDDYFNIDDLPSPSHSPISAEVESEKSEGSEYANSRKDSEVDEAVLLSAGNSRSPNALPDRTHSEPQLLTPKVKEDEVDADTEPRPFVVGQPVEIRFGNKDQWSPARIIKRHSPQRFVVELSTKLQLEVNASQVRPAKQALHGARPDMVDSIKCGWLMKAPGSVAGRKPNFVSRFFILNAAHLLHYRDDASKYPKGKISFKHGDTIRRVGDLRLEIELNEGESLKSNNIILTNLPIQSDSQRVQGESVGDSMVPTNTRKIILKAESKAICSEWLDALSAMLESLKFAAALTSEQLQRYSWHPWITKDGAVVVRQTTYDPDDPVNDESWCMPLPIAVTRLINIEAQNSSKKNGPKNSLGRMDWDTSTLDGIAAWVVYLTPDNAEWRRSVHRPPLSAVKKDVVKLIGRALILLVRVGDADGAAIIAERAVLLCYTHVALASLSFALSILSDAIQRMQCPPMDVLQSRKFSDPVSNARKALDYIKQESPPKGKSHINEPIPPELHYFISLKAYNSLENAQRQRGENWKKTEKDAKAMKKAKEKALGENLRAIPTALLFPCVATPAPWVVKLCDEQKYLLAKNMIGHHAVLSRILSVSQSGDDESSKKDNKSGGGSSDSQATAEVAPRKSTASLIAEIVSGARPAEPRSCTDVEKLMAPRKYYSRTETLARITTSFVRRKGHGNAFERSNMNIVEEAMSHAAKPVSVIEQANLDLLWDVNFLRRLHFEDLSDVSDRPSSRRSRDLRNTASAAATATEAPRTNSRRRSMSATLTSARRYSEDLSLPPEATLREQQYLKRLTSKFDPRSIDEDIDEGFFFRRHWWGDARWRKLLELIAQQQARPLVYQTIKKLVHDTMGEDIWIDLKDKLSLFMKAETYLRDCLERNLQTRRNAHGRQISLSEKTLQEVSAAGTVSEDMHNADPHVSTSPDAEDAATSSSTVERQQPTAGSDTESQRPRPPSPPPTKFDQASPASTSEFVGTEDLEYNSNPQPQHDASAPETAGNSVENAADASSQENVESFIQQQTDRDATNLTEQNDASASPFFSARKQQIKSATLPAISLREIPLSSIRARFLCFQKCAVKNLCGHVDGLGALYTEHAQKSKAALKRAAFDVGFERSSKKNDANVPKLLLCPERHESLSGLLHSWQEKLIDHLSSLQSYGERLQSTETMGTLRQYFASSQSEFVQLAKEWDQTEDNIHRVYRELNRARTTLLNRIQAEKHLRQLAHKKVSGISKASDWWATAQKSKEFERWKSAAHQVFVAFEVVMDQLQDLHFAIAQAMLHKWETADFLRRTEEHLINLQKKKLGAIIDGERILLSSRLAQLDRLYETATTVDAESDLRMMTHSIQLHQQHIERRQQQRIQQQQALEASGDGSPSNAVSGALSFVGRRLAEATGVGVDAIDPTVPIYPPIIRSLAAVDNEEDIPPEAAELVDAFISELFEAHIATSSPGQDVADTSDERDKTSQAIMKQLLQLGFDIDLANAAVHRHPSSMNLALEYCTMGGDAEDIEAEEHTTLQGAIQRTKQRLRNQSDTESVPNEVSSPIAQGAPSTETLPNPSIPAGQADAAAAPSALKPETEASYASLNDVRESDKKLVVYFAHQAVRARFLRELNNRRQECNVGPFFDRLKFLIYGLLDSCSPTVDVDAIRQVMIMTQTYYRDRKDFSSRVTTASVKISDTDSDREHLCNSELGQHPLWKNAALWEEMFLLAVSDEVNKLPPPRRVRPPAHLLMQSEWEESLILPDAVELFYASKNMYVFLGF